MELRTYVDTDLEHCRALWFELNDYHRKLYDAPTIGGDHPELQFDEHLEVVGAENIWVCTDRGKIVGMIGYMPDQHEIEPIIVAEGHRGRGVGERLLDHVIQLARERGVRRLSLRPVARNSNAIAMFHRAGFETLGRVELAMYLEESKTEWHSGVELSGLPFSY